MRAVVLSCLALAGCASSPEYVASQGNFDVCRLTMRGPHAQAAEAEAARRGLDCRTYYPAIQAQQANDNAAIQNYLRSTQSPAMRCSTVRLGDTLQTRCY